MSGGTDTRIAEIQERVNAATEGPWRVEWDESERLGGYGIARWPWRIKGVCDFAEEEGDEAAAAFIAHAREDVPWLLAELERVSREAEQLRDALPALDRLYEVANDFLCQEYPLGTGHPADHEAARLSRAVAEAGAALNTIRPAGSRAAAGRVPGDTTT